MSLIDPVFGEEKAHTCVLHHLAAPPTNKETPNSNTMAGPVQAESGREQQSDPECVLT